MHGQTGAVPRASTRPVEARIKVCSRQGGVDERWGWHRGWDNEVAMQGAGWGTQQEGHSSAGGQEQEDRDTAMQDRDTAM